MSGPGVRTQIPSQLLRHQLAIRAMHRHERSLVKNLRGQPFTLIGVNSDPKAKVKAALKWENITWRSFWDGGKTGGPIASTYQLRGWPTIYMFDRQVIGDLLAKVDGSTAVAGVSNARGPVAKRRDFVHSTAPFKIRAKFVEFQGGKAFLEKGGGEVIGISITQLIAADQKYIRDLLKNN